MTRWLIPLLAFGLPTAACAQRAEIVDGDTLKVAGETIRLWGVDAPEGRQLCQDRRGVDYRCGDAAREHLQTLVGRETVTCRTRDRDAYGRVVGQCRVGDVDLGDALVRSGWAVEYRQFSQGAYGAAEAQARAARRGLWSGQFTTPADWRAEQRAVAVPTAPPSRACAIKGNLNTKGRRIFHRPGQQDYAATVINEAKGERWFCSAGEAAAAGWTPAQR